jgi:hypothetical protein
VLGVKVLRAFFIMALLLSTLAIALGFGTTQGSAEVSGIAKPSVPEFTVKPIGPSFDMPPVYSLDRDTGEIVLAESGYHVEYSAVVITIKNQPFSPSFSTEGRQISFFYYNVRIKDHHQSDNYWNELYRVDEGFLSPSKSNYTNIPIPVEGVQNVGIVIPTGTQTDIQVEAMIGSIGRQFNPNATSQLDMYPYVFTGETSGWSNTQTVTLPANTPLSPNPTSSPATTPTQTPSQEPQQTDQNQTITVVAIAVVVIGAYLGLLIYLIKRK